MGVSLFSISLLQPSDDPRRKFSLSLRADVDADMAGIDAYILFVLGSYFACQEVTSFWRHQMVESAVNV